MLLSLLLATAQAGWIPDYSYACSDTLVTMNGVAGWQTGWSAEPWPENGGWCKTSLDIEGGTWGTDSAISNYVVQTGGTYTDLAVQAEMRLTGDDDTIGLVFRWVDDSNFYVLFSTRADAPDVGSGGNIDSYPGTWLYSVVNGTATEIGGNATITPATNVIYTYRAEVVGQDIEVFRDGVSIFSATNGDHASGHAGLYSYALPYGEFRNFQTERWDNDGDGFTPEAGDCDDGDAQVHPGAVEHCGNGDEDCDGNGDDGAIDATEQFVDQDGDGWGDDTTDTELACDPLPDHSEVGGDCDDNDPTANPGAAEIPGNDVDEDCDGYVDMTSPGTGTGTVTGTGSGTGSGTGAGTGSGSGGGTGGDRVYLPMDTGGATAEKIVSGCDCDQGGSPVGPVALLALIGLVRRRQR